MIFDNTGNVKKLARTVDLSTPAGQETFRYERGQEVCASGKGVFRAGVRFVIVDRYMENGYCYYVDSRGNVHRDKDVS